MNKLALVLLLAAMPCLFPQAVKIEDLNVYVTRTSSLFLGDVPDFSRLDLSNTRAVHIEPDGARGEWQALRRGRGKSREVTRYGVFLGATEVDMAWQYVLDDEHWVADYGWVWIAGSSSQSEIVQVFELREGKVYITQQIEADTHGGGKAVGAWFDSHTKALTVKAVGLDSSAGRCCPTHMNVVVFRWDGKQFRRVSAKKVPLPKDN